MKPAGWRPHPLHQPGEYCIVSNRRRDFNVGIVQVYHCIQADQMHSYRERLGKYMPCTFDELLGNFYQRDKDWLLHYVYIVKWMAIMRPGPKGTVAVSFISACEQEHEYAVVLESDLLHAWFDPVNNDTPLFKKA